jgi:uncharacterized membrane protein (DUF2068 family)
MTPSPLPSLPTGAGPRAVAGDATPSPVGETALGAAHPFPPTAAGGSGGGLAADEDGFLPSGSGSGSRSALQPMTGRVARSRGLPFGGSAPHATPTVLRVIAIFALVKAVLCLCGAVIGQLLVRGGVEATLSAWFKALHLDPGGHRLHALIYAVAGIDVGMLRVLSLAFLGYGGLYIAEGVGLWYDHAWGEWLTVIGSGLLLPLEIYEVVAAFTLLKTVLLALNLAVVFYLAARLRRRRRIAVRARTHAYRAR